MPPPAPRTPRPRLLLAPALALLLAGGEAAAGPVITAGNEAYFAANVNLDRCAACGWRPDGTRIQKDTVRYLFSRPSGVEVAVTLSHPAACQPRPDSAFCVRVTVAGGADPGDTCGADFLKQMILDGIRTNPGTFSWATPQPYPGDPAPPVVSAQFILAGALVLFLLAALIHGLARTRPWRVLTPTEALALAACVAAAAAARLLVEPFPADLQLATRQGFGLVGAHNWSAAYSLLLHLLFALFPASLDTVALANTFLACATVVALFAFMEVYIGDRLATLAGAALFACQPISVRFAASDSAHILLTLALFMAALHTALWLRRGGYFLALQVAGWLALCANTRVEGLVCAGAVACVAAGAVTRESRGTVRQLLVAALPGLALSASPAWEALSAMASRPDMATIYWLGLLRSPFLHSPYSPAAAIALAGVGAVVALATRRIRRAGLLWIAAMAVMSLPTFYKAEPTLEYSLRHCLPALPMFSLFSGVGLGWLLGPGLGRLLGRAAARRVGPVLPWVALLAAALAALPHLDFLDRRWTHQLEFEFLQANLGRVEDGCTVVAIGQRDQHVGLGLFPALSHEVGRGHRWVELSRFLGSSPPLGRCTIFIESASCHASHRRPGSAGDGLHGECRQVMERYRLEPLARTTVPALPFAGEIYTSDPIPLGIHRVMGRLEP